MRKPKTMGRPTRFGEKLDSNGLTPEQNEWLRREASDRGVYKRDVIREAVWRFMKECEQESQPAN